MPMAPTMAELLSMSTDTPKRSRAALTVGMSFDSCTHPLSDRLNTYADPESRPFVSEKYAPAMAVVLEIETDWPKRSPGAPSFASNFAVSVQLPSAPLRKT